MVLTRDQVGYPPPDSELSTSYDMTIDLRGLGTDTAMVATGVLATMSAIETAEVLAQVLAITRIKKRSLSQPDRV